VALLAAAHLAPSAPAATTTPDAFARQLEARAARWKAERGKPEAALAVLGTMDLWDLTDPAAITRFLGDAAADAKAHPLARAHAAYLAEEAAVRRGDAAGAAKHRAELGLVESWRVIGPFGFDGGDLIGTPYGPEAAIRDREQGKRGEVAWRDVPAAWIRHGVVPLGAMLRPDTQAAAYALTYVWSDAARDVAVRVGSTGATRVWVSGALVVDEKVKNRALYLDQSAGGARLEKGWNPVLVKLAVEDGGWGFTLRLTEPGGRPLALRASAAPPAGEPRAGKVSPGKTPIAVAELRGILETRAKKAGKKQREAAWRDLAAYLDAVGPDDPQGKPVETALEPIGWEDGPAEPATLLLAARAAESPDVRRRAADRAALAAGAKPWEHAEAHWRLSAYYLGEQGQLRRAREELAAALASDPSYWLAELDLAEVIGALGMPELARARVEGVVAARPHAARALRRLASFEAGAGRPEVARRLWEAVAKVDADDVGPWARLADLAKDRGDGGGWIAALRKVRDLRPTSVGAALTLAYALVDRGDVPGALEVLDEALVVAPDDPRLNEESGRLMVERGGAARKAEGVARLHRALAVKPQNPELRRYLARVAPDADDDLERQYARDARKLIAQYAGWETGAENAVVLLDLQVVRVHENGLSETYVQRLIRVQDQTGASNEQVQGVQYSPATQSVELRAARVYKASGEIVEAKTQGTREVSEPWYGMYYDIRADMVGFERLEPGDVIEFSYVLADTGRRNLFADYFGDLYYLAGAAPQAEVEYTLLAPPGRAFNWHVPGMKGLRRVDDKAGGEARTRFVVQKVPKVELDPGMPGWTEAAPYLHVSTYASWDQVARWYWRLVEEQLVADEAVKKAARGAVAGLKTDDEKVRAIHNLVVKQTRYVALELGIHSFKPYRVPQVYERKFGDCKDKASLIVVMLREVGIPAQLVLVRTRRNGNVAEAPASLAVFDHAIAYVPSLDLYLDGTAEFSGSHELPWQDQGVMVLRIDGGDGLLTRTPVLPAAQNRTTRTLRLDMAEPGQVSLVEDTVTEGQGAAPMRNYYQTEGERLARYEKAWNAALPGFKLKKVVMRDLARLEQPVTVHAEGEVAPLGTRAPTGSWSLPPLGRPSELLRAVARTSKRTHDLLIDYPFETIDDVTWRLPRGARVLAVPRALTIKGKHGEASITVDVIEGERVQVRVKASVRIDVNRVPLAEYAELRDFLGQVDAALNQPIELAP
jgi:transglutaminase-like putative cysteine protease/tetratricopeptide (TPR) repeat protein